MVVAMQAQRKGLIPAHSIPRPRKSHGKAGRIPPNRKKKISTPSKFFARPCRSLPAKRNSEREGFPAAPPYSPTDQSPPTGRQAHGSGQMISRRLSERGNALCFKLPTPEPIWMPPPAPLPPHRGALEQGNAYPLSRSITPPPPKRSSPVEPCCRPCE